jgi:hypothetical protein
MTYNTRPLDCPVCGHAAYRVPRRWVDRLTHLFRPVQRYRCRSMRCGWEGNRSLLTGVLDAEELPPPMPLPGARYLPPAEREK